MLNHVREEIEPRHYTKFDKNELRKKYNKKTKENISEILNEFSYIFYYMLNTRPCYYWNETIRRDIVQKLNQRIKNKEIKIESKIVHYFILAYDTYQQITEVMQDMSHLDLEARLKNRLYRIPTYIAITEGCLTNLYRIIIYIINQTQKEKQYGSQNKLKSMCEILKKNGFDLIVKDINVNIRNAINHGGVLLTNHDRELNFYYREKNQEMKMQMYDWEFETLINQLYDVCSGILLGMIQVFNGNRNLWDKKEILKNKYLAFRWMALKLSSPDVVCQEINDETVERKQLNIIIKTKHIEKSFLTQTAMELILQAYEKYPQYKQYFVYIKNDIRSFGSIRMRKKDVLRIIENNKKIKGYLKRGSKRGDVNLLLISEIKNKALNELKYYKYPGYTDDKMKILRVEDRSIEKRKRLKADLFVGEMKTKKEIIELIEKTINWLKDMDNSFTNTRETIKKGTMEADSIYLYVYQEDRRDNLEIDKNNKNFICFVDYNKDGNTNLKNGGMGKETWKSFLHEKRKNMQIAWQPDRRKKLRKS